jgi:hypothetical protein
MTLRFKLPPGGDVPPVTAARRMGLSLDAFRYVLPTLVARAFPQADETTAISISMPSTSGVAPAIRIFFPTVWTLAEIR